MARNRDRQREYNRQWYAKNRERLTAKRRAYYAAHRERIYETHLKRKYELTPEQYSSMVETQCGACAICSELPQMRNRRFRGLVVDHDHETGKVRGLICSDCNQALGYVQDRPRTLARMIDYLAEV